MWVENAASCRSRLGARHAGVFQGGWCSTSLCAQFFWHSHHVLPDIFTASTCWDASQARATRAGVARAPGGGGEARCGEARGRGGQERLGGVHHRHARRAGGRRDPEAGTPVAIYNRGLHENERDARQFDPALSRRHWTYSKPVQVTTEKQRDAFLAALAGDEDWLYSDEGEAAQAPAFRCGASHRTRQTRQTAHTMQKEGPRHAPPKPLDRDTGSRGRHSSLCSM